jgi:capsular polysaccharide biosynthesis protein
VDDADQTVNIGRAARSSLPASSWTGYKLADTATETGPAADAAAGLASLSFIIAAIRRRKRFWCAAGAVGLLLGTGLFLVHPPPYQATTEVLLTLGPNEDLTTAIQTDAGLAQSRPVAALALHQLGPPESVSGLLASYTATPVTNQLLLITVNAPSSAEALRRADDLTTAFLRFRAVQLRAYQRLASASLSQQDAQSAAQVTSMTRQVNALSRRAASSAQITKLTGLRAQLTQAKSALLLQEQGTRSTERSTRALTNTAVHNSRVINAAALVVHSRHKTAAIYALTGLLGGMAIGLGLVVIHALVSDRLRWRDDIAHALGTTVRLSVGRVRLRRLLPGRRDLAALSNPDIQRIAGHLRGCLPGDSGGAALAVVPADRAEVAALAVAALALSCAKRHKRVIVADLCPGAPAARLFGVRDPGVHAVNVQDTHLVVAVPERGDVVPVGPLTSAVAPAQAEFARADLAAAYSSADVLVTLAALDPMYGAEHLTTWAADVVAIVAVGQSTWMRVQAVGEMVRLAGARLVSAVLVGAEKADESLGVTHVPKAGRNGADDKDLYPPAEDFLVTADGGSGGTPPDGR